MTSTDSWGAFSDDAPWVLDRAELRWMPLAERRRAAAVADVPRLTAPDRLPPGARVLNVAGTLLAAVVPWAVAKRRHRFATPAQSRAVISRRLRRAAERLGPTYIKLGQIISSGEGLFPDELVGEFKLCRDQVRAQPWEVVRQLVEEDLGARLDDVFAEFSPTPIAAASIAQVHTATLRTGERVAVKVQRSGIDEAVRKDLRIMAWLAPHLVGRIPVSSLANPPALVELFAETIVEELDFRIEAANMIDVATMLAELGQDRFVVPRPHPTLVTRRVLVMERLVGFGFDDVAGMRNAGIDTEVVVRTWMVALLEGAMIEGIFHGDLHGGNLVVLPDGRTGLLDYGIVARLPPERRLAFLRMMISAMTNDVHGQVTALRDLGALPAGVDLDAVIRDLRLDGPAVDPTTLTGAQLIAEVQRAVKALLDYGAKMPKALMLYVKNIVFLDGAIGQLAPDLDLLAEVTNISMMFAARHGARLTAELGVDPMHLQVDIDGVKANLGVDADTDELTHRQLRERRRIIQERMRDEAGR